MEIPIRDKIEYLRNYNGRRLRLMEVCGTHTAGIFKSGIRSLLSPEIRLISGPGCPVCVTPTAYIDRCVEYALAPDCALVSFGDMFKVPGSVNSGTAGACAEGGGAGGVSAGAGADGDGSGGVSAGGGAEDSVCAGVPVSLDRARGAGGRVELVYSPFDVLSMAAREPDTTFVVAAVGFETTAPAYALLMEELISRGIENVRLLTALKSAISAIEWVCDKEGASDDAGSPRGRDGNKSVSGGGTGGRIDGFLCPGHVSVITGSRIYMPLAEKYGKPFVIAGFENARLVDAVYELVRLAEDGGECSARAVNLYPEAVKDEGNVKAREITGKYFEKGAAVWRGLGAVYASGLYLKPDFVDFDAGSRCTTQDAALPEGCLCAEVITGHTDPPDCPMFGRGCTPENAQGPCMVSAEGACGVWYAHGANLTALTAS
jgi:hydrogenase expression/formation protein HypD